MCNATVTQVCESGVLVEVEKLLLAEQKDPLNVTSFDDTGKVFVHHPPTNTLAPRVDFRDNRVDTQRRATADNALKA